MVMTEFKVLSLFERQDFPLEFVSMSLMEFDGETGINCGNWACSCNSAGGDMI